LYNASHVPSSGKVGGKKKVEKALRKCSKMLRSSNSKVIWERRTGGKIQAQRPDRPQIVTGGVRRKPRGEQGRSGAWGSQRLMMTLGLRQPPQYKETDLNDMGRRSRNETGQRKSETKERKNRTFVVRKSLISSWGETNQVERGDNGRWGRSSSSKSAPSLEGPEGGASWESKKTEGL